MSRKRGKSRKFVRLWHDLLEDQSYLSLSDSAKVLLVAVAKQYNGSNNGDLSATLKTLAGWNSNSKLSRAIAELITNELIMLTRQGGRNMCSLYALTWESIDECGGKIDIKPTKVPPKPLHISRQKSHETKPKRAKTKQSKTQSLHLLRV